MIRGRRTKWAWCEGSPRLLLAVVVSAVSVAVFNQTFTNVIVPDIRQEYGVTQGQVGWVVAGYMLVFAVGIPLYGRVADLHSIRRVFSLGLLLLAAGSLVCALAPTLPFLVAGRVVQAAGASAIPALGMATVAKSLPPGKRGGAFGLITASVGAAAAAGPLVGGAIASFAGWHGPFYLSFALGLALTPCALLVLPGAPHGNGTPSGFWAAVKHFDVPGGLLLALAAGAALFGITQGQASGIVSPIAAGSFLLAVGSTVLFVSRIRRVSEPFVSPRLFRNTAYLATAGVAFFAMFANMGSLVLTPLMLYEVNGLAAAGIGLVLAPGAVAVAVLSPFVGRLADRLDPRLLIRTGLAIMALSFFFLNAFAAGGSASSVTAGLLGLGIGFAVVNTPSGVAAITALSHSETGVGLGIFQMIVFLGGGFGPAVAATFLALRQGTEALNPLHTIAPAAPFSDAFLLLTAAVLIALIASLGLRGRAAETTGRDGTANEGRLDTEPT